MLKVGANRGAQFFRCTINFLKFLCKKKGAFMNKSRTFDRAANYYDQTRLLLEPIEKFGIPAIHDVIGSGARLLEVGCGTGRMSVPLLERGVNLVGCDLSVPMMERFREKYPSARIAQADAAYLPFPDQHFDAVLTVHVLHLIPAWRAVLHEIQRVLKPGGAYLNVRTWDTVGVSVAGRMREFWRGWMKEHGVDAGHPGVWSHEEMLQELGMLGAQVSEVEAVRYADLIHLRTEIEHLSNRTSSETWDIPEDVFRASVDAVRAWAEKEFGDLDQTFVDEVRFVIHVARF